MLKPGLFGIGLLLLLPAMAAAKPECVVLGYSAAWRDFSSPPSSYNFDGITHLARCFLKPKADGSVTVPDEYFNPDLEKLAHQHGVKLLMSIGGGGVKSSDWLSIADHPQNLQRFISEVDKLMTSNRYDGVDIDWEPADPSQAEWQSYLIMIKRLRERLPHAVITTALATDEYSTRHIPWSDLIADVDFVNVMAYDYSGPWSGIAAHATNLYPAGDYQGQPGHSVQEGMQRLIRDHHVPPAKLLLGMNLWAYRFRVDHIGDKFTANAPGASDDLSYQQILNLRETGHYQMFWDQHAASPYLQRTGGGSVICFESPESIRLKCDYARGLGCAGVMIWNMGADISGSQTPLFDEIMQSWNGKKIPLDRAILETEITDMKQTIDRDKMANTSPTTPAANVPAPAELSSLNVDQLESLAAQLQWYEGQADDALWQSQSVRTYH